MKKVIAAAIVSGMLLAAIAAGSVSGNFASGLTIGIITVVLLAAGSAAAALKERKRHAWN
ncbi:hypothetical protein NCCP2716_06780 [Sporosarcina sp. NCCP-2716]|uniref:hypothetical protein n=1 Tax=Sporosarcina sp. NCCP-2716 TaxID=2943679 RepID=UPI00203FD317|nr:hypothetical protein [Sporosarcina sp. NCCP-2716]GKV68180.1 hypothetical protein NCCP2716_06780 [Sporosarcina sp. NCCP-2716]